jgi:site-specific DNA-methyltransferase (adenine-specific)
MNSRPVREALPGPSGTEALFAQGRLILGDCLEVLSRLDHARFDLAYLDPPFNTGRSFGARQGEGERARGEAAYADNWGGLDGFLSMLEPRLAKLAPLMTAQGSIWIHLDHRGVHDAKLLADRLLGRDAFMGEVIWIPGNGSRRRKAPSVTHQTLLIYAPSGAMHWHADDPILREPYADTSLRMHFAETDADGRHFRERTIAGKTYRYYADVGRQLGSVWSDCPAMRANTPLISEATGYPTQKPEKLLERIVRAASNPDSFVLDPMCGSGTTAAVAARLGRQFVAIDQSELAFETAKKRLMAQGGG